MFSSEDPSRIPELESVRPQLLTLKWLWAFSCSTPLIYLLIAHGLRITGIAERVRKALGSVEASLPVLLVFAGAALAGQIALLILRVRFDRQMKTAGPQPQQVFDIYRRRTYTFLVLSDSTAFLGLLLFLLTGEMWAMLALGSLGLMYYGQSYPSECGLAVRVRRAMDEADSGRGAR